MPHRVKYEQTVTDLKRAVQKKTGIPIEMQQLFWHHKELTPAFNDKTLLDMNLHTGFSLNGYDLVRACGKCARQLTWLGSNGCRHCPRQLMLCCCPHVIEADATSLHSSCLLPYIGHPMHALLTDQFVYAQTEEPDYWPPVKQTAEGLVMLIGGQTSDNEHTQ